MLGHVYIDDLNQLHVELDVQGYYMAMQVDEVGTPVIAVPQECRCRKVGFPVAGCTTDDHCNQAMPCPQDANHACDWRNAMKVDFENAFELMVEQ